MRICVTVLTEYRRVTDRQTDRRKLEHIATAQSSCAMRIARQKNETSCQALQTSPRAHCTVVPPGEFNGIAISRTKQTWLYKVTIYK